MESRMDQYFKACEAENLFINTLRELFDLLHSYGYVGVFDEKDKEKAIALMDKMLTHKIDYLKYRGDDYYEPDD